MTTRIAAGVLAVLLGLLPARAFALAAATQVVRADRIASLAEHIARSLVGDANRALVPAFTIADQNVPAGVVAFAPGLPQMNASYVGVPIAIEIDGRLSRTVVTGFRITSYVQMTVAAHDLTPGTILAADDLRSARMPFTGRPSAAVDGLVGRKLSVPVLRGAAVFSELTCINDIVHAGMPALLIVRDGPVALAADVVARSSGGLGEYVTIFDPQTQRALTGVVTGPNTVELMLPGAN